MMQQQGYYVKFEHLTMLPLTTISHLLTTLPTNLTHYAAWNTKTLAPQHLKDITSEALGETSKHLLQTIAKFLNGIVLCGNIPDAVQSSFFGASLIALSKKDGGVRPIAVGNTLRRLAGKACMFKVSRNLTGEFQPHEMGVCIPSGAEVAVHACQNFIRSEDSNSILLKIDFKNAFNTVRRDAILHKVKESLPQIFPFVFQAYAQPADLVFGKEGVLPKEGVQQGDPLGPLLFSLAIQDLISNCDSKFNMWYLDDGTLGGNADTVFSDFQKIIQAENRLELSINPSKCELICLDSNKENMMLEKFKIIAAEIKLIRKEDLLLLGAPVLPSAVDAALLGKLTSFIRMLEKLDHLDAHESLFLLKNSFAIPKLTYILRTSVCYHSAVLAQYVAVVTFNIPCNIYQFRI